MNIQSKDFIFTAFGVSGREDSVKERIEAFTAELVDEFIYDTTGSLICVKKGEGKDCKKIVLSAHMDTIGFVITYADERGFLRFSEVGHQPEAYLPGKRVIFENGDIGVIGIEKKEHGDKITKEKMFIDIGVKKKDEALNRIKIGDMCAIYSPYAVTDNVITGGWMDDRVGCFVLLEVMENIKSVPNTVYFLFSSQEEVGLRGARTASYNIEPDAGIAVDVTASSDLPEGDILGSSAMGKGAAIKIMDKSVIVQKKLVNYLVGLAEKNGILYQRDVSRIGSTDAHAIQLNKSGTFAGGISIPTRYVHSAGELCSLEDIQACIELALKFCENELPF